MLKLSSYFNRNRFNIISWAVTLVLVTGMIGGALKWRQTSTVQALQPIATSGTQQKTPKIALPVLKDTGEGSGAIEREILIKTNVPADKPRYKAVEYHVVKGDSVFKIAEDFKVKPETVLWANYDVLKDDPHSLAPGMVLRIPPTDGIYYQWKENDTLERWPVNTRPPWMPFSMTPATMST